MAAGEVAAAGAVLSGAASGGLTPAAWLMAGSNVLGQALAPRTPNQSSAFSETTVNSFMDSSAWTVSTGASKAEGGSVSKGFGADIASAAGGLSLPLILAGLLVGLYIWKRA